MREITFRIWDKEDNKFYKPVYDATNGKLEELLIQPNGSLLLRDINGLRGETLFPDRFEIMQFIRSFGERSYSLLQYQVFLKWKTPKK